MATILPFRPKEPLTKEAFAWRLRQLMAERKLTTDKLACLAATSPSAIECYLDAKVWPTPSVRTRLSEALGVAPDDLLPFPYCAPERLG